MPPLNPADPNAPKKPPPLANQKQSSKPSAIISTSRMFAAAHAAASKRKPDAPPSPPPISKPKKHRPLDPIAGQLNDSLNATASHLVTRTTTAIEQTHSKLLQQLADVSETAEKQQEERKTIREFLNSDLGEERLKFRDKQGGENKTITLAARAEGFKAKVERLEGSLRSSLAQMKEAEDRIEVVWGEIQQLVRGKGDGSKVPQATKGKGGERNELSPKLLEMRKYWEGRIKEMIEEKVEKMKASEKEMKVRDKRKSLELQKVFGQSQ